MEITAARLELTDVQVLELKKIRDTNSKLIKALREEKGTDVSVKIKALKKAERLKMEQILGKDLLQEKIKWDKARAPKKKK